MVSDVWCHIVTWTWPTQPTMKSLSISPSQLTHLLELWVSVQGIKDWTTTPLPASQLTIAINRLSAQKGRCLTRLFISPHWCLRCVFVIFMPLQHVIFFSLCRCIVIHFCLYYSSTWHVRMLGKGRHHRLFTLEESWWDPLCLECWQTSEFFTELLTCIRCHIFPGWWYNALLRR